MACLTLDTDILVDLLRGRKKAATVIEMFEKSLERLNTTVINLFELYYGAYRLGSADEIAAVRELENTLEILQLTPKIAEIAGKELAKLAKQGKLIDIRDLLIGIIARENKCTLVTGNIKHFERISELNILNWKNITT